MRGIRALFYRPQFLQFGVSCLVQKKTHLFARLYCTQTKTMSAPTGKIQNRSDPLHQYIADNSLRLHPVQEKLIKITREVPRSTMIGSADEIQLLQHLIRSIGGKNCLDVGVFTGYSALGWALVIPEDGKVIACDVDAENPTKYGLPCWKEAGVDHKIDLRIAPATETLQKLIDDGQSGTFDFAFIDADKPGYDTYYEQCLKLLRSGGIIALDNMLWGGRVADPSHEDPDTVAIRALNKKVNEDDRVYSSLLKLGDGTHLAFKK